VRSHCDIRTILSDSGWLILLELSILCLKFPRGWVCPSFSLGRIYRLVTSSVGDLVVSSDVRCHPVLSNEYFKLAAINTRKIWSVALNLPLRIL
jgi:hypothetical protein